MIDIAENIVSIPVGTVGCANGHIYKQASLPLRLGKLIESSCNPLIILYTWKPNIYYTVLYLKYAQ